MQLLVNLNTRQFYFSSYRQKSLRSNFTHTVTAVHAIPGQYCQRPGSISGLAYPITSRRLSSAASIRRHLAVGIQNHLPHSATSSSNRTAQGSHHVENKAHCVPVSPEFWEAQVRICRIPLCPEIKSISDEMMHTEPTWYFAQHFPFIHS